MANTKFKIEKQIHEVIRDIPEAAKINESLERGLITLDEALLKLILIIKKERMRR